MFITEISGGLIIKAPVQVQARSIMKNQISDHVQKNIDSYGKSLLTSWQLGMTSLRLLFLVGEADTGTDTVIELPVY